LVLIGLMILMGFTWFNELVLVTFNVLVGLAVLLV